MSEDVKNFGLIGVGSTIQLGKRGSRLKNDAGVIQVRNAADAAFARIQAADPTVPDDLVTLRHLNSLSGININDGMDVPLGVPTDGSLAGGAVPLGSSDTVTDAIDGLNEVLGKLVPSQPPNFPGGQTLTITGTAGTSPVLASGSVPDNTNGGTLPATAGQSVSRITSATATSSTIGDTGPGDSGTITAYLNGSAAGAVTLASGIQSGNLDNGVLRVNDNKDYPSGTPGFWETVDAFINGAAVSTGWNRFRLGHSNAGTTNEVYFVRDDLTATPTLAGGTVAEQTAGTYAYSSGVPHYGSGGVLSLTGLTMTNLAGETYYNGNPIAVTGTNSIISQDNISYATAGIVTPIARQTTTATAISALSVNVDGSTFNVGQIQVRGTNVNGQGNLLSVGPQILVKTNSSGRVDEMVIDVHDSELPTTPTTADAFRVDMVTGDTPAATFTGTASDWNPETGLEAHDAAVVAGVLSHNVTNYSTGYLPAGPDYSVGRSGAQYVTFAFRRSPVSKFDINVTAPAGVAGCWVKLVGVSDSYSSANGWWNMNVPYGGAGVPGDIGAGNGSNGCALNGILALNSALSNARRTCTFGQASSSAATNNLILVRFRLNAGQSITALSFRGASN